MHARTLGQTHTPRARAHVRTKADKVSLNPEERSERRRGGNVVLMVMVMMTMMMMM